MEAPWLLGLQSFGKLGFRELLSSRPLIGDAECRRGPYGDALEPTVLAGIFSLRPVLCNLVLRGIMQLALELHTHCSNVDKGTTILLL